MSATYGQLRSRGFSLVELIVASVVGVMVAGTVATSLFQMLKTRTTSLARQQAWSRAESAAGMIGLDVQSAARNADALHSKLQIIDGGGATSDSLLMLIKTLRPVRGEDWTPEGDECESQYRVQAAGDKLALWRRIDPALDRAIDGGGVASPVVIGVKHVSLQALNGSQWFDTWDSDSDGMPHAIRIVVTAESDDSSRSAVFRRVIAVDRVPLAPPESESSDDTSSQPSGQSPTGGTTTGGGTSGGRPGAGGGTGGGGSGTGTRGGRG